jgi:hypothetical protein
MIFLRIVAALGGRCNTMENCACFRSELKGKVELTLPVCILCVLSIAPKSKLCLKSTVKGSVNSFYELVGLVLCKDTCLSQLIAPAPILLEECALATG